MTIMKACTTFSFSLLAGQMMLPDQSGIMDSGALIQPDYPSSDALSSEENSFTLSEHAPLAGAFKDEGTITQLFYRREPELEKKAFRILSNEAKNRDGGSELLWAQLHLEALGGTLAHTASGGSETVLRCINDNEIGGHITALKSEHRASRFWAVRGLAKTDDARAVLPLLKAMGDTDDEIRAMAANGLRRFSPARVIVPLIEAFGDKNSDMRIHAFQTILTFGNETVSPLIEALGRHKNRHVRAWSALALGKLGDPRALSPLITALQEDKSPDVRANVAEALGKLGNARATTPLIMALEDNRVAVRGKVVDALGELGDIRALVAVIRALEDKNASVRENAAWALGELGDKRAVDALIKVLGTDKNANVRAGSAKSLGELGAVRVAALLILALKDRHDHVRSFAAEAMEALASKIQQVPPTETFEGGDEHARLAARAFLSGMNGSILDDIVRRGDPKDIEPLVQLLGRLHEPKTLCKALEYLHTRGHKAVMPAMRKRLMALPRFEQIAHRKHLGSHFDGLLFMEI